MPSYSTKTGHERLERFEDSWETNASAETEFGNVKLVEIKSVITASNAKKAEIALAEQKVKTLKIEHKNIINDGMEKCDYHCPRRRRRQTIRTGQRTLRRIRLYPRIGEKERRQKKSYAGIINRKIKIKRKRTGNFAVLFYFSI